MDARTTLHVKAGQEIARCGATGSADQPHLHIHAQRADTPVPLRFGDRKRFLLRNDHFSSPERPTE